MSELARQSGVPAPTIKHYIREGLLPAPPLRTSRNMAYYDTALVPRIRAIKEAQRSRYLPLSVIRDALQGDTPLDAPLDDALLAIERNLKAREPDVRRSRAELLASGMPAEELDFFVSLGAVTPLREGGADVFAGDDLVLLRTLAAARRAGISPAMLPHTILVSYVKAIAELVRVELELLRTGIVPRAGRDLGAIVDSAALLSERLVVLLRRKLLLPMLRELAAPAQPTGTERPARRAGRRSQRPRS